MKKNCKITAMMYDFLKGEEIETDLQLFTGLSIGDTVRHINAGKHSGNSSKIPDIIGTVINLEYQGRHHWGGHCVTATVQWSNGETYTLDCKLLVRSPI